MLNSNFFSKKQFNLSIEGLNLWLKQRYNIAFKNSDLDKQIEYFSKYISFINYKQKYIQEKSCSIKPVITAKEERYLLQLLQDQNIFIKLQ